MIKISLGQLKAVYENGAMEKLADMELPVKSVFKLIKLLKEIEPELKNLDETRIKLIKKYGKEVKDENGEENIQVKDEEKDNYMKEWIEILNTEVEFDYEKFSLNDLGDIKLNTKDMLVLEPFFEIQ